MSTDNSTGAPGIIHEAADIAKRPRVRRLGFTDNDGDSFTVTGTHHHVSVTSESTGVSIVFRNEDAKRMADMIIKVWND